MQQALHGTRVLAPALATVLLLAALALCSLTRPAQGHDWYDEECCSGKDCAPAYPGEVVRTQEGWLIVPLRITIPFARTRTSADDQFHYCRYRQGKGSLIAPIGKLPCLYVPLQAM
jgi:hypothetical protein